MNCRCVYVPVPKEIEGFPRLTKETRPAIKELGKEVEHTTESYSQWLRRQVKEDPEFVKDVLGPTRFELFKKGKISLSAMSTNGRIRKLSELQA
jgi:DNA relaxase NicK